MKQTHDTPNSLSALPIGKSGIVDSLKISGSKRRRLLDLGLVEGARVQALHQSPAGDPKAYAVMGAVIALRSEDARNIILKPETSY